MPCSDDHWHAVWTGYHATPFPELYIDRKPLEAVMECHRSYYNFNELEVLTRVPARTAKQMHCRKDALFKMLVAHGKICGKLNADA